MILYIFFNAQKYIFFITAENNVLSIYSTVTDFAKFLG